MSTYAIDVLSGKLSVYPQGSLNNTVTLAVAPGPGDNTYSVGQIAVDTVADTAYVLVDVTAGVATWQAIGAGGAVPDASETVKGILELATQAETDAGIDDLRAVTPLKLQNKSGLIYVNPRTIVANDTLVSNDIAVVNTAGNVDLALPAASAVGDFIWLLNIGTGNFDILQGAGQQMRYGVETSTVGPAGQMSCYLQGDCVTLVCTVANLSWQVINAIGNFNLV